MRKNSQWACEGLFWINVRKTGPKQKQRHTCSLSDGLEKCGLHCAVLTREQGDVKK